MGNNVDIICIDFAKTFDTVPHKQLIYQLSLYCIKGNFFKRISDYLNMRKIYVYVVTPMYPAEQFTQSVNLLKVKTEFEKLYCKLGYYPFTTCKGAGTS